MKPRACGAKVDLRCVYKVKGRGELRSRYWRLQEGSGEEHAKACDRGGQEGEEGEVQRQREGCAGSKLLHTKSEKCPLNLSVH